MMMLVLVEESEEIIMIQPSLSLQLLNSLLGYVSADRQLVDSLGLGTLPPRSLRNRFIHMTLDSNWNDLFMTQRRRMLFLITGVAIYRVLPYSRLRVPQDSSHEYSITHD